VPALIALLALGAVVAGCQSAVPPVPEGRPRRPLGETAPDLVTSAIRGIGALLHLSREKVLMERYPTFESPERVEVGQELSVLFSLTEELRTPEAAVTEGAVTPEGRLQLELPADADAWTIEVALLAPGFTIRGADSATITLPRSGSSSPARFRLVAEPIGMPEQRRPIFVTLWHQGTYLARVVRQVTVADPALAATGPALSSARAAGPAPVATAAPLELQLGLVPADLTLLLLHDRHPDGSATVTLMVESPHLQPTRGRFDLPPDTSAWLGHQYEALSALARVPRGTVVTPARGADLRSPEDTVEAHVAFARGFGRTLYDRLAPPAFKAAFWTLRDALGESFRSIQVLSDDPLVPWELMRARRGAEETDFLGIDFRIARWHVSEDSMPLLRPPQGVELRDLVTIAPRYAEDGLPYAPVEVEALRKLPGFRALPGRFDDVSRLFSGGGAPGVIHFVGHGVVHAGAGVPPDYAIRLEDRDVDLMTFRGLATHDHGHHPLVFLNACDVGGAGHVLNFVEGWAPAVLEAGASGYVGGLWPLADRGAADFAARFYGLLDAGLAGTSVAVTDLLRAARKRFYETGDPTYLGYVFYGDPNLRLIRVGSAS
jgi:hypothetical protein